MKLTQWIEDSKNGVHPPGSYEAQMAVRCVFAKMNPSLDFDQTQAWLKAQRERPDTVLSREIAQANPDKVACRVCGSLVIRGNGRTSICKPCDGMQIQMRKLVRERGVAPTATKARK